VRPSKETKIEDEKNLHSSYMYKTDSIYGRRNIGLKKENNALGLAFGHS
jgi:hypothetical protein